MSSGARAKGWRRGLSTQGILGPCNIHEVRGWHQVPLDCLDRATRQAFLRRWGDGIGLFTQFSGIVAVVAVVVVVVVVIVRLVVVVVVAVVAVVAAIAVAAVVVVVVALRKQG